MRDLVAKFYREAIDDVLGNFPELKKAVLESGKKEIVIDNITAQMKLVEQRRTRVMQKDGTFRLNLTMDKIRSLVTDFVKMHAQAAIKVKEKEIGITEDNSMSRIFIPERKKVLTIRRVKNMTKSGILLPNGVKA